MFGGMAASIFTSTRVAGGFPGGSSSVRWRVPHPILAVCPARVEPWMNWQGIKTICVLTNAGNRLHLGKGDIFKLMDYAPWNAGIGRIGLRRPQTPSARSAGAGSSMPPPEVSLWPSNAVMTLLPPTEGNENLGTPSLVMPCMDYGISCILKRLGLGA